MKKFVSVLLSIAMVLAAVPLSFSFVETTVSADSDDDLLYVDVTDYTYTITPILGEFMDYIYVKTDNPNPYSFQFVDYDSAYADNEELYLWYEQYTTYQFYEKRFDDVAYDSADSFRVNGGYIFICSIGSSDGGQLTLMQADAESYAWPYTYSYGADGEIDAYEYFYYEDTGVTVTAPVMIDAEQYLIDTYTTSDQDFFEKLDAVQEALEDISVYPRGVYDSSRPTGTYPLFATSPYAELSLNEHYDSVYETAEGRLLSYVYPFVLSSIGFPSMIISVAQRLESTAKASATSIHYLKDITFNGETKTYGGAGSGGRDPVYTKDIDTLFTFDGTSGDFYAEGTVESYYTKLMSYGSDLTDEMRDLLEGDTFIATITATGGTWIRTLQEGFSYGIAKDFAYLIPYAMYEGVAVVSDAWVDGLYINEYEALEEGATFEEHPTADIVITNMTYTDADGVEHTQDVLFEYLDYDILGEPKWYASSAFHGYYELATMPDEFVLTQEEVEAMNLGTAEYTEPETFLIYDGTASPGTEYTVQTGDVNLDDEIDYLDAMTVLRYDAELITLSSTTQKTGDVNGDGEVDSLDAILILRYDAGLITAF